MHALLVDGLNLVRRIYAAVPEAADAERHRQDVLQSVTRSVQRALGQHRPSHALCAFDGEGKSWRHELLPSYKENRPPMPAPLASMLGEIETAIEGLGVKTVRVEGVEADDVLATIAVKIAAHGGAAVLLSTDKSMLSLLRPGITVRNHFDGADLDRAYVTRRFGVEPEQVTTFLALVGENSQSVPGVKSIGAKTAARLIASHGTLDAILAAAPTMEGRVGKALRDHRVDAELSLRLMTLKLDVAVGVHSHDFRFVQN